MVYVLLYSTYIEGEANNKLYTWISIITNVKPVKGL